MMTHEQIFSEDSNDNYFGFESILLVLCVLYTCLSPGEFIGPNLNDELLHST